MSLPHHWGQPAFLNPVHVSQQWEHVHWAKAHHPGSPDQTQNLRVILRVEGGNLPGGEGANSRTWEEGESERVTSTPCLQASLAVLIHPPPGSER